MTGEEKAAKKERDTAKATEGAQLLSGAFGVAIGFIVQHTEHDILYCLGWGLFSAIVMYLFLAMVLYGEGE